MKALPVVDIGSVRLGLDDLQENDVQQVAEQLMKAFTTVGFVYLTNHGVDQAMVGEIFLLKYNAEK